MPRVSVLWSVHRKADQWDTRGPVRTWKPCSFPVTPSRRWQQRDGLQERQHQQPEQRYFHAGGKGRREDSLLSPLYGHTAEEAAEVGREGPHAGHSETVRGKRNATDFTVSLLPFPPTAHAVSCCFKFTLLYPSRHSFPFVFWGFLLFTCSKLVFLSEAEDVHGEGG